jgi:hypothetical protein
MSNSNQVKLSYVEESTYGTNPGGTLIDLPITSHSMGMQRGFVRSNVIRSDRNVFDIIPTNLSAPGQVGGELNYTTWDEWLRYALQDSAWSSTVTSTGTYTVASVSTITRASGSFISDGLLENSWVKVTGAVTAANNGWFKVGTVAALTLTLSTNTLSIEGAATLTILMGAEIINGVAQKSLTLEEFDVGANLFRTFTGAVINGFDLTIPATGVIGLSWDLLAKTEVLGTVTTGSGNTAVNSNPVMNGASSPAFIYDAASAQTTLTDLSLSVRNNLRPQNAIGTLGLTGVGAGTFEVRGRLSKYFANTTLYTKFIAATTSALFFRLTDTSGNSYVFDMPAVKFTEGKRTIQGKDGDVLMEMGFEAFYLAEDLCTLRIVRFAA